MKNGKKAEILMVVFYQIKEANRGIVERDVNDVSEAGIISIPGSHL